MAGRKQCFKTFFSKFGKLQLLIRRYQKIGIFLYNYSFFSPCSFLHLNLLTKYLENEKYTSYSPPTHSSEIFTHFFRAFGTSFYQRISFFSMYIFPIFKILPDILRMSFLSLMQTQTVKNMTIVLNNVEIICMHIQIIEIKIKSLRVSIYIL